MGLIHAGRWVAAGAAKVGRKAAMALAGANACATFGEDPSSVCLMNCQPAQIVVITAPKTAWPIPGRNEN